jgi:RNA polymerase sigma-70 factor (ECF subfamily)
MGRLSNLTDNNLLVCLKKGDIAAFDELYHRYSRKLMAFSITFFPDQQLAEEAVQEIFVRVWERRKKLDETKSFKSYLFQAIKFFMFNYIRNRKKDCCLENVSDDFLVSLSNHEDELVYQEMEGIVIDLIEKLPMVQKEVFKLNKLKGMSSEQIAHHMNLSKRTIEHHIYLASKSLKKKLLYNPSLCLMIFIIIFF